MIRVLIVDDSAILRNALKTIVEQDKEIKVVGLASNGKEAVSICESISPDIVLMDIRMPLLNGVEGTKIIKSKNNAIKVLILTTFDDHEYISEAINSGADGYVLKDIRDEDLITAIKSTINGFSILQHSVFKSLKINQSVQNEKRNKYEIINEEYNLTSREQEIIKLIVDGCSNKEIASCLNIAEGTVRNIISNILLKLDLSDRTQLAVFAIKSNLV
ncbi:MAG: response regulator transcription factor [Clostridia bacterium]|nr:response regulator transcription factor [Clostridia bacterium]